jgi:ERO1-like protein alpha
VGNALVFGSVSTITPIDPAICREERVFYRCVSGIHASINVHIARRYLFGRHRWSHNTRIYKDRIRAYPERIENLHFVYALVLRSMNKMAPMLAFRADYLTGNTTEDARTSSLLRQVLDSPLIRGPVDGCPMTFAEHEMFRGCCADCLVQFRAHFRNISKIMDCVGCEKCRLWGKLQFLGLGTAFKILFADTPSAAPSNRSDLELTRNEVVALINLLKNLCLSIRSIHEMEWLIVQEARRQRLWLCLVAAVLCGLGSILIRHFAGDILSYRGQIRRNATERRLKRN